MYAGKLGGCLTRLSLTGPHPDDPLTQGTVSAGCRAQSPTRRSHLVAGGGWEQEADSHAHGEAVAAEAAVCAGVQSPSARHVTLSGRLFPVCEVARCEFN